MTNWVLIPCRNNAPLLQAAINSVLAQNIEDVRIFAINNGSIDNTTQVLNQLGNGHIVVNSYPQLGVAGAWNFGLNYLFNSNNDSVLVINQDVILSPNLYQTLKQDGGEFVTAVSVKDKKQLRAEIISTERRPHPDFSCFLIRKTCWSKVGQFDEEYFPAFAEDSSYHVRMHRAGVRAYCLDLPFYHYGSATIKLANEAEQKYISERAEMNRDLFYTKYGAHIGIPEEYDQLFSEAEFGRDKKVTTL